MVLKIYLKILFKWEKKVLRWMNGCSENAYLLHSYTLSKEIAIHFPIQSSSQHMLIQIAFYLTIVDALASDVQYRIHHLLYYHLGHRIRALWMEKLKKKNKTILPKTFHTWLCENKNTLVTTSLQFANFKENWNAIFCMTDASKLNWMFCFHF